MRHRRPGVAQGRPPKARGVESVASELADPASDSRADYEYRGGDIEDRETAAALADRIDGSVRFDAYTRSMYATDASSYEVLPIGVVFPTSTDDVAAVMRYCAAESIPVLPRGGGTSLAGQAVNEAVVLDFTRHMDGVLTVEPADRTATAQVGVTIGALDRAVEPHGLKFPPDPSTAERSALGGAIGNNSTGAHSLKYGKTDAYLETVEVVLADGSVTTFGDTSIEMIEARADPAGNREAQIYSAVRRVIDDHAEEIRDAYPNLKRNVSGYNLDVLVDEAATGSVNLARLFAGSEGTLGIVTQATVSLEAIPATKAIGLLTYRDLGDAMADVEAILDHDPAALEVMDGVLLDLARETAEFGDLVRELPDGTDSFLLVEFYVDDRAAGRERVARLLEDRVGELAFDALEAYDAADRDRLWKMRKASTPILLSRTGDEKFISFIEDIAVPPSALPDYVSDFRALFDRHGTVGSFYAHAGPGCLHVRPLIDTASVAGMETMVAIADDATDLAVKYGGSVSGEHGDGRSRTQWNRKLYGDGVFELFRDLKDAFDPEWLLNPGPVCGDVDMRENLRFDLDGEFEAGFDPALDWENENGFRGMVELCHGCGGCRTTQTGGGGVMCPTYRAADEEITSTRGRANLLRQAMTGTLPRSAMDDDRFLDEVLDLCIGCKGCARDCPSEVDMASLKVELQYARQQEQGATLRTRLFANVDRLARIGAATAPVSNWLGGLPGAGRLQEALLGIARERQPPRFHRRTFVKWFEDRGGAAIDERTADARVILVPETMTNYTNPGAGRAAVLALEAANVHVSVPADLGDTGRPAYSNGMLDLARDRADAMIEELHPKVREGWVVTVLEPSDAVMLQADYEKLRPGPETRAVAESTYGVMEYLDRFDAVDRLVPAEPDEAVVYHGHCHQTAVGRETHAVSVLDRLGYEVTALDSGCCGMAGNFGYEAEHHSMSRAIGRILFEQIGATADPGDILVAPGASCRTQIHDGLDRTARHPIELVEPA